MPLIDLIIQDLHKEISDSYDPESAVELDELDAYRLGAQHASEGAEAYLRKIFPDN